MVRFIIAAALLAAAAFVAANAHAEDERFYVSGFLGANIGVTQKLDGATAAGAVRHIEAPLQDDISGGVALGLVAKEAGWGRVRLEGEFSARDNDVDKLVLNGVRRQLLDGHTSVTSEMVNFLYDTPKYWDRVRFTVGAGVGVATVDYNIHYLVTAAGPQIAIPTSVTELGYQAILGTSYEVMQGIELTADARYFGVADQQAERFNASAGTLDSVLTAKYASTSLNLGVRYHF
jgi:opacity protein-like surface antigen